MTITEKVTALLNKLVREDKVISQVELAEKMNVSKISVYKWLNGGAIDIEKVPKLCEILNISPNELFDYIPKGSEEREILYRAFKAHPEHQQSIKVLLEIKEG